MNRMIAAPLFEWDMRSATQFNTKVWLTEVDFDTVTPPRRLRWTLNGNGDNAQVRVEMWSADRWQEVWVTPWEKVSSPYCHPETNKYRMNADELAASWNALIEQAGDSAAIVLFGVEKAIGVA